MFFLYDYCILFYYFLFSFVIAGLMALVGRYCGPFRYDSEKLSAYECGFEPFTSARIKFDISFAVIAILYLIFDLEIVILIPWVLYAVLLGINAYIVVLFFLSILLIGFVVELAHSVFDWNFIRNYQ
jgi:NADH-quinone oxidoreductase subunit A